MERQRFITTISITALSFFLFQVFAYAETTQKQLSEAKHDTPVPFTPKYLVGDATKGKMKYMLCISCHGSKGEGNVATKSAALPAQQDWYLQSQLQKFKLGMRGTQPADLPGMQMRAMSMTLATEQDMADVVAYIKTFPTTLVTPTLKGDIAKGKNTFESVCIECHGPKAHGIKEKQSPSLLGLTDWYIVTQINNVQSGARGYAPNDLVVHEKKKKIAKLTDKQDIVNVALYILTLQENTTSK